MQYRSYYSVFFALFMRFYGVSSCLEHGLSCFICIEQGGEHLGHIMMFYSKQSRLEIFNARPILFGVPQIAGIQYSYPGGWIVIPTRTRPSMTL